ncbi:acid protease [Aulographum hederae CBS 113979]|uniref:Acid protease n=1 Tax=Aulographum hederae CBS 113979 TaxID=1176131 RepID=A0A6G1HBS3_9PEZI|nr:acid protease [Aulographum hederae CBS 113979]
MDLKGKDEAPRQVRNAHVTGVSLETATPAAAVPREVVFQEGVQGGTVDLWTDELSLILHHVLAKTSDSSRVITWPGYKHGTLGFKSSSPTSVVRPWTSTHGNRDSFSSAKSRTTDCSLAKSSLSYGMALRRLFSPLFLSLIIASSSLLIPRANAQSTAVATVLNVPPDQYWDGNDGPWSTFGVQVGTPTQNVRLLPWSGGTAVWVVVPEGCTPDDPHDCPDDRGMIFDRNASITWEEIGIYELAITEEGKLGYSGNGVYGNDTVTLGWQGQGLPTLDRQVVTGIPPKDFYLGVIPLSYLPTNFTTYDDPRPSLLTNLKNEHYIPSVSWGYTAGGNKLDPPVFGSLTLGGYDTSRFVQNDLSIPLGADQSRDLLVAVQSISTNATDTPLSAQPFYAFIDSIVSQIWLPEAACSAFETAFNLTYNEDNNIYTVSNSSRASLLRENPIVTFTLGASSSQPGPSVNITMPYWAFDLTLTPASPLNPNTDQDTNYFPLRRGANNSQYTLGRAFLQSAYVIANYEHANFSVSQALYPDQSVPANLVPILAPLTQSSPGASGTSQISGGAIAGIAVGAAAIIVLVAVGAWFFIRRRQRRNSSGTSGRAEMGETTAATGPAAEGQGLHFKPELDAIETTVLPTGRKNAVEADGEDAFRSELDGGAKDRAELAAAGADGKGMGAGGASELDVPPVMFEMPANEPVLPHELESPAGSERGGSNIAGSAVSGGRQYRGHGFPSSPSRPSPMSPSPLSGSEIGSSGTGAAAGHGWDRRTRNHPEISPQDTSAEGESTLDSQSTTFGSSSASGSRSGRSLFDRLRGRGGPSEAGTYTMGSTGTGTGTTAVDELELQQAGKGASRHPPPPPPPPTRPAPGGRGRDRFSWEA